MFLSDARLSAAVAGDSLFVEVIPYGDSQLLFELAKVGMIFEIVAEIIDCEDGRKDAGQFPSQVRPLFFRNDREIGCKEQDDRIVFRKQQSTEEYLIGQTYCLREGCCPFDLLIVALCGHAAALFDEPCVPLFGWMPLLKEVK